VDYNCSSFLFAPERPDYSFTHIIADTLPISGKSRSILPKAIGKYRKSGGEFEKHPHKRGEKMRVVFFLSKKIETPHRR
jgi:hypothetical protein